MALLHTGLGLGGGEWEVESRVYFWEGDLLTLGLIIECANSAQCAPFKHHFDECVERVHAQHSDHKHKGPKEDCLEECEFSFLPYTTRLWGCWGVAVVEVLVQLGGGFGRLCMECVDTLLTVGFDG